MPIVSNIKQIFTIGKSDPVKNVAPNYSWFLLSSDFWSFSSRKKLSSYFVWILLSNFFLFHRDGRRLRLISGGRGLVCRILHQSHPFPGVLLPLQNWLVVQELGTLKKSQGNSLDMYQLTISERSVNHKTMVFVSK